MFSSRANCFLRNAFKINIPFRPQQTRQFTPKFTPSWQQLQFDATKRFISTRAFNTSRLFGRPPIGFFASNSTVATSHALPPLSRPSVGYWLLFSSALVFGVVVVGGVTRLTESGLSITEWKPITGILPPLNQAQWEEEFEKYKATPEFKLYVPSFGPLILEANRRFDTV